MKRIILIISIFLVLSTQAFAFLYEVKILTAEEITKLTDEQLVESYTDVIVERKASESFHMRAGYTPKEYAKFKNILHFIVKLRYEMAKRAMEVSPIEEWLR